MIIGIQAALTKLKAFVDSFTRADNGATLQAAGTKSWQNTRGTWGISSNRASTATAASSYPLASVKTGSTYARTRIDYGTAGQFGWGAAFWVENSNNWYAAVTDRDTYGVAFSYTAYACNGCPGGYQVCNSYPSCTCGNSACQGGNGPCNYYQPCNGCGSCGSGAACNGVGTGTSCQNPCGGGCYFVNNGSACQCEMGGITSVGSYSYQVSGTTTYYRYWVRTIKSTLGSVSVVDSTVKGDTTDSSRYFDYVQVSTETPSSQYVRIATVLNGAAATTHDVNLSTAAKAKAYGIALYPVTSGTQASTVDSFDYQPL